MKKLLIIVIFIFAVLVGYKNSDYVVRFIALHSTVISKTVEAKEMIVISKDDDATLLKDDEGNIFAIIDNRFNMGEELEVGIDNNGTTDITDDVIVWTIKK